MINIQHVMLNDTTQLAKLCISVGIKVGLLQKDIHYSRPCLQQGMSQVLYAKDVISSHGQTYP